MNERNKKLFTNSVVVYDFCDNGDVTCMRTRFEEYDCVHLSDEILRTRVQCV